MGDFISKPSLIWERRQYLTQQMFRAMMLFRILNSKLSGWKMEEVLRVSISSIFSLNTKQRCF